MSPLSHEAPLRHEAPLPRDLPLPHELLWDLATAGVAARCLHTVAELGVADHLDHTPVPVASLATACDVAPDALNRVLRLLVAHGVFDGTAEGYRHNPASTLLRTDHPRSMRPFAQLMGLPLTWGSLTELVRSVRTNRPGIEVLQASGIWRYLQDRPAEAEVFGRAMTAKAGADVAAVLHGYDFSRFETVADVGGARGHLLLAVLDAVPEATGILFELPEVVGSLDIEHPRMSAVAGDFFVDALPAADAYLLMEVLHDWADDECVAILAAIRRAARMDATVLVVEGVLTDDRPDPRSGTLDVVMLAVTGGRERTPAELGALFERAGFVLQRVIPTAGPMRIVEARAAAAMSG